MSHPLLLLRRSLSVVAPHTWNSLPSDVRSCRTVDTFKRQLKTHLFRPWCHQRLCIIGLYGAIQMLLLLLLLNKHNKNNIKNDRSRRLTCPCIFIMTTVLDRLQTTNCSTLRGSGWMLCTVMSVPARPPRDLNVFRHSVLLMFQTLIVPSELALTCQQLYTATKQITAYDGSLLELLHHTGCLCEWIHMKQFPSHYCSQSLSPSRGISKS